MYGDHTPNSLRTAHTLSVSYHLKPDQNSFLTESEFDNLVIMETKLKEYLADIELSEQQEQNGQILTQSEVEQQSKEWLK